VLLTCRNCRLSIIKCVPSSSPGSTEVPAIHPAHPVDSSSSALRNLRDSDPKVCDSVSGAPLGSS
jgi:hypothetical protein